MIILLELLMIAGVLLFIGRPFFIKEYDSFALETGEGEHREDLLQKKEYAFETLSDLDLDLNAGKISEEDYKSLKKKYEHEAIEVLKELDHLGENGEAKKSSVAPGKEPEEPPVSETATPEKSHFCTQCGASADIGDKFCNQCGSKL